MRLITPENVVRRRRILRVTTFLSVLLAVAAFQQLACAAEPDFPDELVRFESSSRNPVFTAAGSDHWDARIRERGWILKDGDTWRLWYTGYDGTRDGKKMLGLATSPDGLTWTRHSANPIYRDHWVEDMQVVKHADTYHMFAEGAEDQAQLLKSSDGVRWERIGPLDVRLTNGEPIPRGPYGTPTVFYENEKWFLFYERSDRGVWLATSKDMRQWRNVQDEPVLKPGPDEYDRDSVALNQVIKHGNRYYAYYHGSADSARDKNGATDGRRRPTLWSTAVAVSDDLVHWKKYPKNPLFPLAENKSSGIVVHDGKQLRLYTMHDKVDVHFEKAQDPKSDPIPHSTFPIPHSEFSWTVGAPVVAPADRPTDPCYSIKDPTVVRYQDRWHLFCTIRSQKRSHQIEYLSFADWKDAAKAKRHILTITDGYFCAPQVFYFTPHKKWYLIYQASDPARKVALQPAWSTSGDIADPSSWTSPKFLFDKHPENVQMWIDFWVICDEQKAHLFFTSLDGKMWRSETPLHKFPAGWDQPRVVLNADIFEASHTYRLKGMDKYLTVVEAQNSGRRYYKAYLADRLDGEWQPLTATREKPFASPVNVKDTAAHWTDSFSHGEFLRAGYDERLEVDPQKLRFLFQGVTDEKMAGKVYGQIPWQLGILEPAQ
jgi:hypothetical protein